MNPKFGMHVHVHASVCFRYKYPSISLTRNFKPLAFFRDSTARFVSDPVRNPEDRFSLDAAHIFSAFSCQKKTFMTGDCWGYTGQQCVNRLGFICRCTGDIEVVSWPRNFQINQEAYKEQQGFEQKQKKERLAAEQRAAAAEQRANYGGPMDYGGQQFPDYNDFMDDIDFGDYDSLQGQQLPQMYQMPPQWPPQQMPDSGGRKF